MNEFENMTTAELQRAIGATTRQLDALAAQIQGIRYAFQNGRGTDTMRQQQTAAEGQAQVLRNRKKKLQQALTNERHPAPRVAPAVEREAFNVTAGLAVSREREQRIGR